MTNVLGTTTCPPPTPRATTSVEEEKKERPPTVLVSLPLLNTNTQYYAILLSRMIATVQ